MRGRDSGAVGIQEAVAALAEAEFDERARIGNDLVLPAIVFLIFRQCVFRRLIPLPTGLTGKIVSAYQRFLNLPGAGAVRRLLAALPGSGALHGTALAGVSRGLAGFPNRRLGMRRRGCTGFVRGYRLRI